MTVYPNLFVEFGWNEGVYPSPTGYEHPWLCVTKYGTTGHWSRSEARRELRLARAGRSESALLDRLNREAEEEFWGEVSRQFSGKKGE